MSDGNGILQEIIENPSDDTLRLIYADWLEDIGESEHSEFIRLQIKRHQRNCEFCHGLGRDVRGVCPDPICHAMRSKELQLMAGKDWFPCDKTVTWLKNLDSPSINWTGRNTSHISFTIQRGFIAEVTCRQGDWLKYGKEIANNQPVERVRLFDKVPCHLQFVQPLYGWYPASFPFVGNDAIALEIVKYLEDVGAEMHMDGPVLYYVANTLEKAYEFLSKACLLYARN